MMESKNAGSLPDDRAHAINTTATAAAREDHERVLGRRLPRLLGDPATRPHVAGADVPGQEHPVHLLSGDRSDGGQQDRDHRQEEEGGEDEEHEREEHLHRCGPRALGGGRTSNLAHVGGEVLDLLGER
jgi:hypothetical protein